MQIFHKSQHCCLCTVAQTWHQPHRTLNRIIESTRKTRTQDARTNKHATLQVRQLSICLSSTVLYIDWTSFINLHRPQHRKFYQSMLPVKVTFNYTCQRNKFINPRGNKYLHMHKSCRAQHICDHCQLYPSQGPFHVRWFDEDGGPLQKIPMELSSTFDQPWLRHSTTVRKPLEVYRYWRCCPWHQISRWIWHDTNLASWRCMEL